MLNRPATVYTGEKIRASHLNDLITYYNEIWSGGTYTFDVNHNTTNDNRRFGWGQNNAVISPTPAVGSLIKADDMNQAIVQVNAGQYHISDIPTDLLSKIAVNHTDPISPVLYNQVVDQIETFESKKYKTDWSTLSLSELQTQMTQPWNLDLYCVHKYEFTNYNEARHFFNSGGELTLELSMPSGGGAGNDTWRRIFEQFDSIRIGAEGCKLVQDDSDPKDILSTSTLAPKGFYNGITNDGAWNTILDAGVFKYHGGDYEYAYAYVYVYGEYNSRRIRLQLKADEAGGKFNVYVKVILIEDIDDTFQIGNPITLTLGHSTPATTPLPNDGNASYMTQGTLRQFIKRNSPSIFLVTGWTEDELGSGEQFESVFQLFENLFPTSLGVQDETIFAKIDATETLRNSAFDGTTRLTEFDNLYSDLIKFNWQAFITAYDALDRSAYPNLDVAVGKYFEKNFGLLNDMGYSNYVQSFADYAEFKTFFTANQSAIEADITDMISNKAVGFTYNTDYLKLILTQLTTPADLSPGHHPRHTFSKQTQLFDWVKQ